MCVCVCVCVCVCMLVARTIGEYENIAVLLPLDAFMYRKLRDKVAKQRKESTLFNRRLWALRMEHSYMQIGDLWAASVAPMHTVLAASCPTDK